MKKVLFLATFLAIGLKCSAAPILTAVPTVLGGELAAFHAFDISVTDPGDPAGSYLVALTFTGQINKESFQAGGKTINPTDDATAKAWDGIGTYIAAVDTWAYTSKFSLLTGFLYIPTYTSNSYAIIEGTGGGNPLTSFPLAHVTVLGESVSYSGTISHNGFDFPVQGTFAVPEPATWLLFALGLSAAIPSYFRRATTIGR